MRHISKYNSIISWK